jgi:hypothetical protein
MPKQVPKNEMALLKKMALKLFVVGAILTLSVVYGGKALASCDTPSWADGQTTNATCASDSIGNGYCQTDSNPGGSTMLVCFYHTLTADERVPGSPITETCSGTTCPRESGGGGDDGGEDCGYWDPYTNDYKPCWGD